MAMKVFEYVAPAAKTKLGANQARLNRFGWLLLRAQDLRPFVRSEHVAVLLDEDNLRIGLRAPREEERAMAFPVLYLGKHRQTMRLPLLGALEALKLDKKAVAGSYTLERKADFLVLILDIKRK